MSGTRYVQLPCARTRCQQQCVVRNRVTLVQLHGRIGDGGCGDAGTNIDTVDGCTEYHLIDRFRAQQQLLGHRRSAVGGPRFTTDQRDGPGEALGA